MLDKKICVLGTDERSKYIRKMYVSEFGSLNSFDNANIIIGPTPFSKDDVKVNGESLEVRVHFGRLLVKMKERSLASQ